MGRRRALLEDAALELAADLGAFGADLVEVIPSGDIQNNSHLPALRLRLQRVIDAPWTSPALRDDAARIIETSSDLLAALGRGGDAGVTWSDIRSDNPADAYYRCHWYLDEFCDDAEIADLDEALSWARDRSRRVIVRPAWDPGTVYRAGEAPQPEDLPELPVPGVRIAPPARLPEDPALQRHDPPPFVPDQPLRARKPIPYRDYHTDVSWPDALDTLEQSLVEQAVARGAGPQRRPEREMRWLVSELRWLLTDLEARGIDTR